MSDAYLAWPSFGTTQGDFVAAADGDILVVDGEAEAVQRIVRRLMTNRRDILANGAILPCDYIYDVSYGGSLRRQVGATSYAQTANAIRMAVQQQIAAEIDFVSLTPPPVATITQLGPNIWVQATFTFKPTGRLLSVPRFQLA